MKSACLGWAAFLCLAFLTPATWAQISVPAFDIQLPVETNGWVRFSSSFHSNAVLTLEASTNFGSWRRIGTLHDALFSYPDAETGGFDQRFYRLLAAPRDSSDDWKNEVLFPEEPFRSTQALFEVGWVKFAILLSDLARVVYQDSAKFPFHYDFATQRLDPFLGMNPAEFDAISLHRTNQQVVLGTVLYPPGTNHVEYGVQFVGLDPYTPEEISGWFELVKATVFATNGSGVYYMPVFEQSEMARTNAAEFEARGIAIDSVERWLNVSHIYSPGWALGTLKFFTASEIDEAFNDGRLRPADILLTDGVPAETPLVAGIISLTPSTPNSHTAILSKSFGVPFVHLADAAARARVQLIDGHQVILRATTDFEGDDIKVLDVEGMLDPELESELLALKQPPPIEFMPKQTFGAYSASTDTLVPTDIQYFGGKAANYGLLRDSIPTNSPPAIAFSFDLWDEFLDQTLPGGGTLRQEIDARLAGYTNYPPDIPSLKTNLDVIRDIIRQTADFTPAQRQAITNALTIFDPSRKIRFRSSTNVEDSEHFTGAGLYDSYSGCLLDDLDGDSVGPSICDPGEADERGVFRAIKRVYASFYNDNAFLERLRHGVDESQVGMAVLVHHSFPDEEELANGVATMRFNFMSGSRSYSGDLVTQLGAESVTNPDGTSVPEVVGVFGFGSSVSLTLTRRSSLVPLGAYVMDWESDYLEFVDLLKSIAEAFHAFYPGKQQVFLDFEYKKDANLGLVVKQVREVPAPGTTNQVVPFLVNEPTTYRVAQREAADVFSNHRLKSIWMLETKTMRLTASNLFTGIYTDGQLEYLSNTTMQLLNGPVSSWPNASNSPSGSMNYWTTGSGTNQRAWSLNTALVTNVTGSTPPVLTQRDFEKYVTVNYSVPMPKVVGSDPPTTTTSEIVVLELIPEIGPGDLPQQRSISTTNGVTIETDFYWPNPIGAPIAGYTAPLVHFEETRITGLTTNPIVLTNYYSQTYRPGHHNFSEEFIFEPRLEPGLPPATLAELEAANVQLIYVFLGHSPGPIVRVLGLDGKFRDG